MMLQRSVYKLKNAAKTGFELIKKVFEAAGTIQTQSVPFVFHVDRIIAVCFVDDLLVFSKTKEVLIQLIENLMGDIIMKDLRLPI